MTTPLPIGEWEVNSWRIKMVQGAKGPGDRKVFVASPGGEQCLLTLASLGAIARAWYINEAIHYDRPGQRGGEMVLDFLRAAASGHSFEDACARYKLSPPDIRKVE